MFNWFNARRNAAPGRSSRFWKPRLETLEGRDLLAAVYLYDPGLGTLPEDQGFTRFDNFGTEPEPIVSGSLLHQFSSGAGPTGGAQYWTRNSEVLDFATTSYALEADLLVHSSNYDLVSTFPNQRSGYYLGATDSSGRAFAVGIASTGITINTDLGFSPTNGVPFTPFDSTDAIHTYRLLIDSGVGSLFIDGTLFASTPLGGAVNPGAANRVLFGDLSGAGASETDLGGFSFVTPESDMLSAQINVLPNTVNLANNGVIGVAILTTANFDAATVDANSVLFAGASAVHNALEDVDSDGDLDMVLHFRTQDTDLRALYEQLLADDINEDGVLDSNHQVAEVTLTGQTVDEVFFEGSDDLDLFLAGKSLRQLLQEMVAAGII